MKAKLSIRDHCIDVLVPSRELSKILVGLVRDYCYWSLLYPLEICKTMVSVRRGRKFERDIFWLQALLNSISL